LRPAHSDLVAGFRAIAHPSGYKLDELLVTAS